MAETPDEVVNEQAKPKQQPKQADGPSPEPADPQQALEAAQEALAKAQFNVAEQDKKDKLQAELPKLVEAYEKEAEAVAKSEEVLRKYAEAEKNGLGQVLTDAGTAKVIEVRDRIDGEITQKEAQLETGKGELKAKEGEVGDSVKNRDKMKAAFEGLKKGAAAIKERQRRVEALRSEIDKAESAGDFAVAYWLLVEKFQAELDSQPQPIAASEYQGKLSGAWTDLSKAEADLREKDLALKKATKALEDLKKDVAALNKDRDANIRAELEKIALPSAGASPAEPAEEGQ